MFNIVTWLRLSPGHFEGNHFGDENCAYDNDDDDEDDYDCLTGTNLIYSLKCAYQQKIDIKV